MVEINPRRTNKKSLKPAKVPHRKEVHERKILSRKKLSYELQKPKGFLVARSNETSDQSTKQSLSTPFRKHKITSSQNEKHIFEKKREVVEFQNYNSKLKQTPKTVTTRLQKLASLSILTHL